MTTRRDFLERVGWTLGGAATVGWINPPSADTAAWRRRLEAMVSREDTPEALARDEDLWLTVQQAYTVDRTILNLDNGGVNPAPRIVQEAMQAHLEHAHKAPVYSLGYLQRSGLGSVRAQLARAFGCGDDELALTRNTTEAMEILLLGLDLEPGDEIVTTTRDYWRFLNTWKQREQRDGVVLRQVELSLPADNADEVVRRFEAACTPRTRVLMMCHVNNLTGQILPVREVAALARRRGLRLFVDGAHGFAQFPFTRDDLDCDFYTTSLHKWLGAPHGTGFLYVRRDEIPTVWPLQPAPLEMQETIQKFENVGTVPAANHLAIAEALQFYDVLGPDVKTARLRYLRDYWLDEFVGRSRLRVITSREPDQSCALTTIQIEGVDAGSLADTLWREHRILVKTIRHPEFDAVRVTPNVYTTLAELDRFSAALDDILAGRLEVREGKTNG